MLDIKLLREEPDKVKEGIQKKGVKPALVDEFLALDGTWRKLTQELDERRALLNEQSRHFGVYAEDAEVARRDAARGHKARIKELEKKEKDIIEKRDAILGQLPNIPFDDVPVGKDESENREIEKGKTEKPEFDFPVRDYLSLGEPYLVDIERAGKVSGSRFGYIKNEAVLLEFALVKFAFDTLLPEGFTPVVPPVMVRPEVMRGMGKTKFIEDKDAFHVQEDDLYLVGSSEHSIGPMYMNEVFNENAGLPMRYVGFSTCFRREAGSYGKDTKGILRVHQFDKVEMFSFTKPEQSEEEHKFFLSIQRKMMDALGLHYRVVEICTGDMGWGDARQYDIETWLPGQDAYRETQSCSNTTAFQARGLNIKYKKEDGKTDFVHTLNGTAFAIGRMLIAIMENYQTKDGKIHVPKVLQEYVGKDIIG